MTDRQGFLAAIRAEPADDVRRLVYADWLDDHGESDLDRATSEFIRLSCDRHGRDTMPAAAYRWLLDVTYVPDGPRVRAVATANWRRLVPALLGAHRGGTPIADERHGRRVWCELRLLLTLPGDRLPVHRPTPANLYFRRGFLEALKVCHAGARALLAPLARADQPLCRIEAPPVRESPVFFPQTAPAASLVTREGRP